MKATPEQQKLAYAKRLLKRELAREGFGSTYYAEAIAGCNSAIAYCERFKHYHEGIVKIMASLEERRSVLVQIRNDRDVIASEDYRKKQENKEWLRFSFI